MVEIILPKQISDHRLDTFLKIFFLIKNKHGIHLNWSNVSEISPAGLAILSCLFDSIIENKVQVKNTKIKKEFKNIPAVANLSNILQYKALPAPSIQNYHDENSILRGNTLIDINFIDNIYELCGIKLSKELLFSCKLIFNELMINSIDHSSSERYYTYAGKSGKEFHIGVLDMGVGIPAKLEQKYICTNDLAYLELALKEGSTTRRQRPGGLGLSHTLDVLKNHQGKLTILSRNAQIKQYFLTRKTAKSILTYQLNGTWCFTRFPWS